MPAKAKRSHYNFGRDAFMAVATLIMIYAIATMMS